MNTLKTRLREFKLAGILNSLEERVSYATITISKEAIKAAKHIP